MPAIYNYPIGGPQGKEDTHDLMGIYSFECFGEVREENATGGRRLIKEVLNCKEISLRFSEDISRHILVESKKEVR